MGESLVDLSLFADFPAREHHFVSSEIPYFQRLQHNQVWEDVTTYAPYQDANTTTTKPLPPIPSRKLAEFLPDCRRENVNASRCILSRVARLRSSNHQSRSPSMGNTLQQRRSLTSGPPLLLPINPLPSRHTEQRGSRPALPMIWLQDQQMWLIADGSAVVNDPSAHNDFPPVYSPPYAYSEPSPSQPEHEFSPIRSQFMTLMEQRRIEQRQVGEQGVDDGLSGLSLLFQEAMNGVSMDDFMNWDGPDEQISRAPSSDSRRSGSTMRRESWHSAISGISPLETTASLTFISPPQGTLFRSRSSRI